MKKLYKLSLALIGSVIALSACSDWTDTEIKDPADLVNAEKTPEYYQKLREWKKTDHQVTFGWFGGWVGNGLSQEHSLRGLPDSVDLVSIWGNFKNLDDARKADLKYAQEVKGIKVMFCYIVDNVGAQLTPEGEDESFWGATDSIRIVNYANAICDTIDKYGYDGFDYDYEPNYGHYGNISGNPWAERIFVRTLSKRIGPLSGTGKLLCIDGEPQTIASDLGECFDWFIVQAYNCGSDANLDWRIGRTINNFDGYLTPAEVAKKYIITENFENYALLGGVNYTDRYGNSMKSLEGMARYVAAYKGQQLRKGGVGTYHMEYEYIVSGYDETYPFLRKAIQIMNPQIN